MKLIVHPSKELNGIISPDSENRLPGDKSLSHRAALLSSIAQGTSKIHNFQVSGVTQVMLQALHQLGISWQIEGGCLTVEGKGVQGYSHPINTIDCGNSGTTMRLLAGAIACSNVPAILDGSPGLRRRPMDRIVVPMQEMGVLIASTAGCAPLKIDPKEFPLKAIDHILNVASAQVKSCLLITALQASGPCTFSEPGPSRDHMERMLAAMGIVIIKEKINNECVGFQSIYRTYIEPIGHNQLISFDIRLAGDISAASFFIVAALITPGSEIILEHVLLNPTRTGLLDALKTMGGDVHFTLTGEENGEPVGQVIARHSPMKGTSVSGEQVIRMIDEFPVFAVAAAYATGTTVVSEAEELKYKETDRISVLCQELNKLGIHAQITQDGFIIQGGKPVVGGKVSSHGDHRLAMAFSVAGLAAQSPVCVCEAEYISESFPDFINIITRLGARVSSIDS